MKCKWWSKSTKWLDFVIQNKSYIRYMIEMIKTKSSETVQDGQNAWLEKAVSIVLEIYPFGKLKSEIIWKWQSNMQLYTFGFFGIFDRKASNHRLKASFNILRRTIKLEIEGWRIYYQNLKIVIYTAESGRYLSSAL